jgi:hypothetical protein
MTSSIFLFLRISLLLRILLLHFLLRFTFTLLTTQLVLIRFTIAFRFFFSFKVLILTFILISFSQNLHLFLLHYNLHLPCPKILNKTVQLTPLNPQKLNRFLLLSQHNLQIKLLIGRINSIKLSSLNILNPKIQNRLRYKY